MSNQSSNNSMPSKAPKPPTPPKPPKPPKSSVASAPSEPSVQPAASAPPVSPPTPQYAAPQYTAPPANNTYPPASPYAYPYSQPAPTQSPGNWMGAVSIILGLLWVRERAMFTKYERLNVELRGQIISDTTGVSVSSFSLYSTKQEQNRTSGTPRMLKSCFQWRRLPVPTALMLRNHAGVLR